MHGRSRLVAKTTPLQGPNVGSKSLSRGKGKGNGKTKASPNPKGLGKGKAPQSFFLQGRQNTPSANSGQLLHALRTLIDRATRKPEDLLARLQNLVQTASQGKKLTKKEKPNTRWVAKMSAPKLMPG